MIDPLFWLGLSILLVAVSLTAVLVAALPALQELARAARSVEKLADTLRRELPPTLEAIRLTGLEISDLTDDVSEGVKSAGQVAKQVDQSLSSAKNQAKNVQVSTRSVVAGVKAAWKIWRSPSTGRRSIERLPPSQRGSLELRGGDSSDAYSELSEGNADSGTRKAPHHNLQGESVSRKQREDLDAFEGDTDY
ncbi:MAG: DUF948 domain-containing protein [Potamolinea sp.]